MPRGIFRLKQVYEEQLSGQWSTKGDVWLSPSPFRAAHPFGYFGGGGTSYSIVDRVDYSNDTATAAVKGPLSLGRAKLAATGNSDFGYFGGGHHTFGGTEKSTVDRVDYSNDTAAAAPKGPLSQSKFNIAATGSSSFGYFGGGEPGPAQSRVDRIDYSNDTATASPKGPLSSVRYSFAATGNQSFGYYGGGTAPSGIMSTVDRVDYSNDTATASPKGPLSAAKRHLGATGNASFGYFGGGGFPVYSTVDRIDYSNDTATAAAKGPLSAPRPSLAATGSSSFGYFGGGGPANVSTVDRVDYSNDTAAAATKGPLSEARGYPAAVSSQANAITTATLLPASSSARENVTPQGTDFGYFGGGQSFAISPPGPEMSTVDRIDYSNDTAAASAKSQLSSRRKGLAATGNASFGYFAGGSDPSASPKSSIVDRLDYSNDSAATSPKGPLSAARDFLSATGNSSFGYFGGGGGGGSTVQRIDYGNDTATAVAKGNLNTNKYRAAATGNINFGYFGGGNLSNVERVDYSNDTATSATKGPLSASNRQYVGATGNADFGYFGGGGNPSAPGPSALSTIDRVDYSNDTATASPKGLLVRIQKGLAATGNASFGYFGGGYEPGGQESFVDRVDYSNDTATAASKGPLSAGRQYLAASSSRANAIPLKGPGVLEFSVALGSFSLPAPQGKDVGYFGGGYAPSPGNFSTVDRVDYSNDTATAVERGPLNVARRAFTATGNASFGYFGG